MMTDLLKKDWRLNRGTLIASFAVLIMLFGMHVIALVASESQYPVTPKHAADALINAGVVGLFLMAIMAAVYGGIAFALERRERWADLLAVLPVSRAQIVLSKLIVVAACMLLAWAIVGSILLVAAQFTLAPNRHLLPVNLVEPVSIAAGMTVMMFGVAWLLSSVLTSPAISAGVSIGATVSLVFGIATICDYVGRTYQVTVIIICSTLAVGVLSLVAGTIYYLRRVEP
jgi:ABC-type transport system involved in multi-copper enzyme maturation permease subunit